MRRPIFIVALALVLLAFLCTCSMPPRTWKRPVIAEEVRKVVCLKSLQITYIDFFTNDEFSEGVAKSKRNSMMDLAEQEARGFLEEKLEKVGFEVNPSFLWKRTNQLHILIGVALRSKLLRFFIVVRVQVYDSDDWNAEKSKRVCEFKAETEVYSDGEEEVRRAGNVLTDKIATELRAVLSPSD